MACESLSDYIYGKITPYHWWFHVVHNMEQHQDRVIYNFILKIVIEKSDKKWSILLGELIFWKQLNVVWYAEASVIIFTGKLLPNIGDFMWSTTWNLFRGTLNCMNITHGRCEKLDCNPKWRVLVTNETSIILGVKFIVKILKIYSIL